MTQFVSRMARAGGLLALGLASFAAFAEAGCNCGGGGAAAMGPAPLMPHYEGSYSPESMGLPSYGIGNPVMGGTVIGGSVFAPGSVAVPGVASVTPEVGPPPGTLGQTYLRPTRPVPVDKHPRVSIIDIRAGGATQVKVYGTNEFRTKDMITGFQDRRDPTLWRFESEPLVPGVPNIYRVEARYGDSIQNRYVRLVPGRIVTLDF